MTSFVKKLELTYICNISSRRANKTTKLGKGKVQVMGHLLVQTMCARASPHAYTGASKNKNAPNDFLLTVLYVSGHLEHFGASAYARVFSRAPLSRPNTVVFSMVLDVWLNSTSIRTPSRPAGPKISLTSPKNVNARACARSDLWYFQITHNSLELTVTPTFYCLFW